MNYNRAALKQAAKQTIRETRPRVWAVTLVYILLTSVVPMAISSLVSNPLTNLANVFAQNPELLETHPEYALQLAGVSAGGGAVVSLFVSVATSLFSMVMNYGYIGYALKVHRREPTDFGDVFSGFSLAGKAIGASIMVAVFTFLWSLLVIIPYTVLFVLSILIADSMAALAVILAIAAIVILFVGVVLISCRYVLTPYYIMDHPDMDILQAITASKTAMRGNIGKYVVLELSFLGWSLLTVLIVWVVLFVGILITFAGNFVAAQAGLLENPAMLLLTAGGPMILVIILAFAASMPLTLWLTGYSNVCYAAFFDIVSGAGAAQPSTQSLHYSYGGVPPIPPAPPAPPVPPVPPAPVEPPVEPSTPDSEPSAGPAEPSVPDETPDVPMEASPDAPETPEAPSQPEE